MSRAIVDKIVEMQFNNTQFEEDVKESISTIAKLKQALDMSVIGESIDAVQVKFSALDSFIKRTVENMADNVYNSAKRMLKSLTVDNISVGWDKFADKTSAVQTIMSATAQTWEDSANEMARANYLMEQGLDEKVAKGIAARYGEVADGTLSITQAAKQLGISADDFKKASEGMDEVVYSGSQMEYVDEQLQRLNWFTDETSYKFLDMVNNIGKFTANNIPLEDSVTAMQGIATWAGISGANANEAGRAMYNLSQAMSVGAVKLQDWKSIENANMATAEFKQTAIETALAMGTLQKGSDGVIRTLKGNEVSVKNFNSALQDSWFSSEVLMSTLDKYGGFSVKMNEVATQTGLTAKEILDYIDDFKKGEFDAQTAVEAVHEALGETSMTAEELTGFIETLSGAEYDLGERAFRAAQQAKTFQDVIDYVREAVSTGWSNTFQNIFGNFEEARDFWSDMAEELYGVFVEAGDERNSLLAAWKEAGGRDDLVEAFWNIFHAVTGIINAIKSAFRDIFPKKTVDDLLLFTSKLKEFTQLLAVTDSKTGELNERGEKIRSTFRGIFAVLGLVKDVIIAILKPAKNLFSGMGGGLLNTTAKLGDTLTAFRDTVRESGVLEKVTKRVGAVFSTLNTFLKDTFELFRGVSFWEGGGGISGVFESMFDGLNNVIRLFFNLISAITGKDLSGVSDKITTTIQKIRDKIVDGLYPFNNIFGKAKKVIGDAFNYIKDVFTKFKTIKVSNVVKFSSDTETAVSPLVRIFEALKNIFSSVWEILKKLSPLIANVVAGVMTFLGNLGKGIAAAIKNADFSKIFDFINTGALSGIGIGIFQFVKNLKKSVSGTGGLLSGLKGLFKMMEGLPEMLDTWKKGKQSEILKNIAISIGILAASLFVLSGIDSASLRNAIEGISLLFVELMASLKFMSTIDKKSMTAISKAGTTLMGMAAAVLVLAIALKKISSLNSKQLTTGLIGITVLLAEMTIVAKVLSSGDNKKMLKGATNAIAFAAAIYVLVGAVKSLATLSLKELGKGLGGLTVIIAELVAASKILSSGKGGSMMKGAANALVFAVALRVLVVSVKSLAEMKIEQLAIGLGGLAVLIAEIVIAAKVLSSGKGGSMLKGAANALIFAAALLVLVKTVKSLAAMDLKSLGVGLGALAILLAEIVLAANLMKGTAGATGSMLVAAVALTALAGALFLFSRLSWESLLKGLVGIGVALTIIGVAAAVMAPLVPALLGMAAALLLISAAAAGFGIALIAIGAGLTMFAASGEAALYAFVKAIEVLITAIPNLIAALAKSIGESIVSIVELVINVGKAVITAAKELVPDLVATVIDIVKTVLTSLADNIQDIVESLLDIVLGVIKGLAAKTPEILSETIGLFKNIFTAITNSLGDINVEDILAASAVVGALIILMGEVAILSAEALLATASLPTIGTNFSTFAKNFMPFINMIEKTDANKLAGIESLARMIAIFTETSIITGLTGWLTGKVDLEAFGKQLESFAPYYVSYANKVSTIDSDIAEKSMAVANSVTAFVQGIPKSGGLAQLVTGGNDLQGFGAALAAFADPFVDFARKVGSLGSSRLDAIKAASMAAESISAFVASIPKTGGLVQLVVGKNDLGKFAEGLSAFAEPFTNFATKVGALTSSQLDAVKAASVAAESISAFVSTIPKTGGLVQLVVGKNDLGKFAKALSEFAGPFVDFATKVGGLSEAQLTSVSAASAAATTIAEFSKIIPPSGGIVQLVTGNNDLAKFGEALASFGPNLKKYANELQGVTLEKVSESGEALIAITKVASKLPETGGVKQWLEGNQSLKEFGEQLASFGPNFAKYANSLQGVKRAGFLVSSSNALKAIAEAASVLPTDSGIVELWASKTTLSDFGAQLAEFGPNFASYAETIKGVGTEDITKSSTALKAIAEAAAALPVDSGIVELWSSKTTLEDFGGQLDKFADKFVSYAGKVGSIKDQGFTNATEAITTLIDIANSLTATGGIKQWFTGEQDLEDFGADLSAFGEEFKAYGDFLANTKLTLIQSTNDVVKSILDTFPGPEDRDYSYIIQLGEAFIQFSLKFQEFGRNFASLSNELPGYTGMFNTVFSIIQSVIERLQSTDVSSLNEYAKALGKVAENLFLQLSSKYAAHYSDLEAIARKMANIIVIETIKKVSDVKSAGKALAQALKKGIESINILNIFISTLTNSVNITNGYYSRFQKAGNYLVSGFVKGIEEKLPAVEKAGNSVGDRALRGINAALDEHSPSRESYKSGTYFIIGFTDALYDGLKTIYAAADATGTTAVDALSDTIAYIADAINGEIELQPVITPVLDLSKVRKSANGIGAMLSYSQAASIGGSLTGGFNGLSGGSVVEFNQYNYSPKALSRIDIYRDTRNMLSTMKGR